MPGWNKKLKRMDKGRLSRFLLYSIIFMFLTSSINFSVSSLEEDPDLAIKNFNAPSEGVEGENITVNVTVENIGGNISDDIDVIVELRIDNQVVDTNGTDEGFSSNAFRYFNLYWIAEIGDHSLKVTVRTVPLQNEPDYLNNQIDTSIYIIQGPPLLKIDTIETPSDIKVNTSIKIKIGIKNVGSNTSKIISTQLKIKEDDYNKILEKKGGLKRGEIHNFTFYWIPKTFGDFTLNITAKLADEIQDQEERNKDVIPFKLKWWNNNWHYRKLVGVYGKGNISLQFNFTECLYNLNLFSKTFENDKIRIIEYSKKGEIIKEIVNFGFIESNDFNEITNSIGNLTWEVSPINENPTAKYFYIYFDVSENKGTRNSIVENDNIEPSNFDLIYDPIVEGWWDLIVNPQEDGYINIQREIF